ncbi:MAG TPA: UDP-N-acetylglucosamine 2-epimerase (non-hydrolyzing) [Nitrososphaeraceae archaeon]|nr:UDP-N-acetylglucosamine 2-epimerase (non-hydrolyzing) [Nitrososphaeraceae archaeon]
MKKIASVVGARPNFIKLAPIHKLINSQEHKNKFEHIIIHTGQHYDYELSEIFFSEFKLSPPNYNLNIGSSTPCIQIAEMIKKLEHFFQSNKIDLVLVYGDTNSTFAGALAAIKSSIKVAHVESGLRSFDREMPEEINRILTDHISNFLYPPTKTAIENLNAENIQGEIIFTGDISVEIIKDAEAKICNSSILEKLNLEPKEYYLFTLHRSENTNFECLKTIINIFKKIPHSKIVFPIHPRTTKILQRNNLYNKLKECNNVILIDPVGYIDFINFIKCASKVITDSGGTQKEAYLLNTPCITIRNNTEWIETISEGWNILTGIDVEKTTDAIINWFPQNLSTHNPIFGNGKTSNIIVNHLKKVLE